MDDCSEFMIYCTFRNSFVKFKLPCSRKYFFVLLLPNFFFFVQDFQKSNLQVIDIQPLRKRQFLSFFSPTDQSDRTDRTDQVDRSDRSDRSDQSEKKIDQITNSRAIPSVEAAPLQNFPCFPWTKKWAVGVSHPEILCY